MKIYSTISHKLAAFAVGLLVLMLSVQPSSAQEKIDIKFLWVDGWETTGKYRLDVLKLALSKQEKPYSVVLANPSPSQRRAAVTLRDSVTPIVMAMGTGTDNERILLPVYAPIYLGIGSGYRLMLTKKSLKTRLRTVNSLSDLKKFTIGQGSGWTDVAILQNAGLQVISVGKEDLLIRMTARGRFDLYSRGLFEFFSEYNANKDSFPSLAIDDHLLVVYQFAIYFFTGPTQKKLRDSILKGMQKAYATGELQDFLVSHKLTRDTLKLANLANRKRIELPPYGISDQTVDALQKFRFIPGKKLGKPPF